MTVIGQLEWGVVVCAETTTERRRRREPGPGMPGTRRGLVTGSGADLESRNSYRPGSQ